MGRYTHLTIEEREDIMCLRREGAGVGRIAREIGRDKSTVSRELRRDA
ncbi:MAG TPA: helix-turn-helix domain-containing protein, partial [Candidatus Aveggerthella excrementigallinarum]|nr:helix-turn-helix domain-containing protein [Candidatus Aveggerthella excrementigallinarum]